MATLNSVDSQISQLKELLEDYYLITIPGTTTKDKNVNRAMGTVAALQRQISHLQRVLESRREVTITDELGTSTKKRKILSKNTRLKTEQHSPTTGSLILPIYGDTKYMDMEDVEQSVIDYIFDESLPMTEVLVENDGNECDRQRLLSLKPATWLEDDVITTVAYHQTLVNITKDQGRDGDLVCFLPATLSTYAAKGVQTPEQAYNIYWLNFFHNAQRCKKVFVPMNDNETHWYLAVIVMSEQRVHMVDSDPSQQTYQNRLGAIQSTMDFMSELFQIIYSKKGSHQASPKFSQFTIVVPKGVPRQPNGYDCGLWVCMWMMNANSTNNYNVGVGSLARMHLALNLVMRFENYKRETITRCALKRWKMMDKQRTTMSLFI